MPDILDQIRDWARSLKYWEQATLEKISTGEKLTDQDYQELVTLWEQDAGLAHVPALRPQLAFTSGSTHASGRPKTRLVRLHNLVDVNALPNGQELPFGLQLTLIFGANGAGKTGYARPLGCAAISRGDREVLPNAELQKPEAIPRADIEVVMEGHRQPVQIHWQAGQRCPELSGFYVFDAESLDVHLLEPNTMSVTPSALALLTTLADETDEVRRRVQVEINMRNAPHTFSTHFQGDSGVGQLVASLGPATDLVQVRKLAILTEVEEKEFKRLEAEATELKLQTNAQRLRAKQQELSDLEGLLRRGQEASKATEAPSIAVAEKLIEDLRETQRLAEQFGAQQFACEPFRRIGTEIWRDFMVAAKGLAEAEESASGTAYPQHDSLCLFCQQSLSSKAIVLINRLWQFLASDAQRRLADARRGCDEKILELQRIQVSYFDQGSGVRRLVETTLPTMVPAIEAHAESAAARIRELADALHTGQQISLPPFVCFDPADLMHLIEISKREVRELEESNEGERLAACEASLRELQHRKALAVHISAIEEHVRGRKWASIAANELGTTAHITRKYNELFDSLVTEKYKTAFQSLLERFGRNLRVSVETRGRKGQTVRQIQLNRDEFPSNPLIAKILSEGEKRAVALADFLAEATTDDSCNGLILDDPVTSFDADWKNKFASYLVEWASADHQVVVFTHDLPFLYEINKGANKCRLDINTHWVQKRNNQPGFLFANNSPACEKEFKTAKYAEESWVKSRDLAATEQELVLKQGFGALRTSYEALVVFYLFNGVVERFEERLRIDLLARVNFDTNLAAEISERSGRLSRYIDAHLHSDQYAAQKPTPETLREEIDKFNLLKKKVKELSGQHDQ